MTGKGDAEELVRRTAFRLSLVGGLGNGLGASIVMAFLIFLAPTTLSDQDLDAIIDRSVPIFIVYMPIVLLLGWQLIQRRPFAPIARWLEEDRPATEAERTAVLGYARNWARWACVPWVLGAALFTLFNLSVDTLAALSGALPILLGGVTACSVQYLLVERLFRPITARALAGRQPPRGSAPGVAGRMAMAWTVATAVPLLGIAVFSAFELTGADFERDRLVGAVLFLSLLGLSVGLATTVFAARSVADPLASMRDALGRVERGDFDARVRVDDASEVGLMQAGFNRMADGLSERERLRDAFGAFVDPGLTERVLKEGTDLAGEEVELSLLFMDVRGFTNFAERADARKVVATLNELYEEVVPVILRHGGHANKFIGDGLLAIFGAPERLPDHADRAVSAALEIAGLVARCFEGRLRIGVGVNSGRVVVGTIGGGGRLDFTVIGDPVNTAARVESATRETGDDVLITAETLDRLSDGARDWTERQPMPLKGKTEEVRLFAPAS